MTLSFITIGFGMTWLVYWPTHFISIYFIQLKFISIKKHRPHCLSWGVISQRCTLGIHIVLVMCGCMCAAHWPTFRINISLLTAHIMQCKASQVPLQYTEKCNFDFKTLWQATGSVLVNILTLIGIMRGTQARMQGVRHTPLKKKANMKKKKRKMKKKITKSRKFTKLTIMPFTNGKKWWFFEGVTPSPIFSKSAPPQINPAYAPGGIKWNQMKFPKQDTSHVIPNPTAM